MAKTKHKDKDRRKRNYQRLRDAGFNSYEANRYKDLNDEKIDVIIYIKLDSEATISDLVKGGKSNG